MSAPHAVHAQIRDLVLADDDYTCVAARSALRRGDYRFGWYPPLGSPVATASLAADLAEFIDRFPIRGDRFATFIASFDGPDGCGEVEFEAAMFEQLQALHDVDVAPWDPAVSADPHERGFSFSFGGRSFFLVGMHPLASRLARRTPKPVIVFNAHAQFELLRDSGRMERMQQINRSRDQRRQGSVNPNLVRFEVDSEAVMYSGRHVEPDWTCPLRISPNKHIPPGRPTSPSGDRHPEETR